MITKIIEYSIFSVNLKNNYPKFWENIEVSISKN
jgi:hypothetical protein